VAQTEAILAAIAPHLQGTVVTDAGSTKSDVVAAARRALGGKVAQFVPGHPIAGRETNGPMRPSTICMSARRWSSPRCRKTPRRMSSAWRAHGAPATPSSTA
jgi:prephenate dehydrogenase